MGANQNNVIYGGDMMLFLSTGATLQPCAFSTSAKLTVNLTDRNTSSKDSGKWDELSSGKFNWTMSTDGLMNLSGVTGTTMSIKELYTQFVLGNLVNVAFAMVAGSTPSWTVATNKLKFTGTALITFMDFNAADNTNGTYSINLKGSGILAVAQ